MSVKTAAARPMTAAEWAILLTLSVLWGGSFYFNGVAVRGLPPFTIVFLRVAIAALALWLVCKIAGVKFPRGAKVWTAFFGMGLLNNLIPFSLIVWGQTQIASGLASILNATTPMFTVLAAHVLTADEKLTGNKIAGILTGFIGVGVMIGPEALEGLSGNVLAELACLGAALSYGFAGIFGKRFGKMGVPPLATATGQVSASALMLAPVAFLVDKPLQLPMPGLNAIGAVLGLAIVSSALAYVLFFRILATAGATNLSLVTLLVPVSAILFGFFLLGEKLEPRDFAGMAIIGLGLAAIDGRLIDFFLGSAKLRGR